MHSCFVRASSYHSYTDGTLSPSDPQLLKIFLLLFPNWFLTSFALQPMRHQSLAEHVFLLRHDNIRVHVLFRAGDESAFFYWYELPCYRYTWVYPSMFSSILPALPSIFFFRKYREHNLKPVHLPASDKRRFQCSYC